MATTNLSPTHLQPPSPGQRSSDQLITVKGTWEHFKLIQRGVEQNSNLRLFYYDGSIDLLMPGREHEVFGHIIGCLISIFLARRGVFFQPTGSMTQEKEGIASAQVDESYCLGAVKPIPDLAIEVVFTSSGTNKLSRYQALEVPEVWFWEDGTLVIYHLRPGGYELIQHSELNELKDLDLALLQRCIRIGETDAGEAIRVFLDG